MSTSDAEFLGNVLRQSVLVDHNVQSLVADESLADVPYTVVLACVAPAVLHDEVLVADLVLGGAVDEHAVVIASLVVVADIEQNGISVTMQAVLSEQLTVQAPQ